MSDEKFSYPTLESIHWGMEQYQRGDLVIVPVWATEYYLRDMIRERERENQPKIQEKENTFGETETWTEGQDKPIPKKGSDSQKGKETEGSFLALRNSARAPQGPKSTRNQNESKRKNETKPQPTPPQPNEKKEPEQEWSLAFTKEFCKAVKENDVNMIGRAIKAFVANIAQNPTELRGDTVKPLEHNLKGLWRLRVGDMRLIYLPDTSKKTITLIALEARGSVYPGL